jgi:predicted metalloprotease
LRSPIRPRLVVAAAVLLVSGGAAYTLTHTDNTPAKEPVRTAAQQAEQQAGRIVGPASGSATHGLILGSKDSAQPKNMEQFLTAVTKDVDAYWSKTFRASDLPEPKVSYTWIPAGQTAKSACGDEDGAMGDSAAAYCAGDDTIYISEKFATDIYDGALDRALPGSSQGYGRTVGDFAVAYMVAHEYGHQVQDELGLFDKYGSQIPTMGFELQADCYAGTWANSAYQENRLEDGDVQEALDAALAVGDFDTANPGHHGTPEQRADAWNSGFESGDPSSCSTYLDPANLGDGATTAPQDTAPGYPQEQDPAYPGDGTGYGYPQQEAGYEPRAVAAARAQATSPRSIAD